MFARSSLRVAQRAAILTVSTFSFLAPLYAADDAAPKPVISVEQPVFSFGEISQGTIIKHDFIVKNIGTADLLIQRAIAGCGCTAALPPTGPILPGQAAPISVQFDSAGFEGSITKEVRVFSNDVETQTPILSLKGQVESGVLIDPVRINFGEVFKGGQMPTRSATVSLKSGNKGEIKSLSTFSQDLTVTTKSITKNKAEAEISLKPEVKTGELRDRVLITIVGEGGVERSFNIPVVAIVKGAVDLQPRTLSVGVIEGAQPIVRSARLTANSKEPLKVLSVTSDSPAVTVDSKVIKDGKAYGITVQVDPAKVKTDLRASVRIETDNKEQGTVILNVYGILPPKQ